MFVRLWLLYRTLSGLYPETAAARRLVLLVRGGRRSIYRQIWQLTSHAAVSQMLSKLFTHVKTVLFPLLRELYLSLPDDLLLLPPQNALSVHTGETLVFRVDFGKENV